MSRSIDQRIVQMEFDNSQFEHGVKTSLMTLENLKKGLELDKAAASLRNLEDTFKGFSVGALDNVARAVDKISERFSLLGEIGAAALHRISDMAISAGAKVVNGLSFSNIGAGFEKYEKMMDATMAMQSATGKSTAEISERLESLMEYTDQTSYKLTEMVTTMGQFTSAGMTDLEMAEKTVEGIANASADAGIGIRDAGRIFQIFSKAMSSGKLGRNQWDSLGLANFTTPKFQKALIAAAKHVGTIDAKTGTIVGKSKKIVVGMDNIADTLKDGWATQQVMAKALELYYDTTGDVARNMGEIGEEFVNLGKDAYAAAQNAKTFTDVVDSVKDAVSSGWMKSFEYMFGDLDYARVFFTDMADTVIEFTAAFSEARNAKLAEWAEKGGRDNLAAGLFNILDIIEAIRNNAFTAWNYIFYGDQLGRIVDFTGGVDALLKLTEGFKNLTQTVKDWFLVLNHVDGEETYETLYSADLINIFKGLFSVLLFCKEAALGFASGLKKIGQKFSPLGKPLLKLFGAIGINLEKISKWFKENKIFDTWSDNIIKGLEPITSKIDKVVEWINKLTDSLGDSGLLFGDFKDETLKLDSPLGKIAKGFASFGNILSQVGGFAANAFSQIVAAVGPSAGDFITWVLNMAGSLGEWITKVEESGVVAATLETWSQKVSSAIGTLQSWVNTAKEWIGSTGIIPAIIKEFQEFLDWLGKIVFGNEETDSVDEFTESVEKETGKIGLVTIALDGMHEALTKIATWFNEHNLGEMIEGFFGNVSGIFGTVFNKISEFFSYDTSDVDGNFISKFASRFNVFRTVDEEGKEIETLLGSIVDTIQSIASFLDSSDMDDLADMAADGIAKLISFFGKIALKITGDLIGEINAINVAKFLMKLKAAINILQALRSVSWFFESISEFMENINMTLDKMFNNSNGYWNNRIRKLATSLIMIGASLWLVADAVAKIGKLGLGGALVGVLSLGAIMFALYKFGGMLNYLSRLKINPLSGLVFIEIAGAVGLLADAIEKISTIGGEGNPMGFFKGLFGAGGALASIVWFTQQLNGYKLSVGSGLAIIEISKAVDLLADAMEKIGKLKDIEWFAGILGGGGALWALVEFTKKLDKIKISVGSGLAIIEIAGAVNILASAIEKIGTISTDNNAFAAVDGALIAGGALWAIIEFSKKLNKVKISPFSGLAIVEIAGAVNILADAIANIAAVGTVFGDDKALEGGLIAGGALWALVEFTKQLNGLKVGFLNGLAIMEIAGAVRILADAITAIGSIDTSNNNFAIADGALATGGVLWALIEFSKKLSGVDISVKSGVAIIEIAGAVRILADALVAIGKLEPDRMMSALVGTTGVSGVLLAFAAAIEQADIDVKTGFTFVELAGAIGLMADGLRKISKLKWEDLGKGIGSMAAVITEELLAVTFLKGVSIGDVTKVLVDIGLFIGGFTAIFTALAELSSFLEEKSGIDVIDDLDYAAELVGKLGAVFGSFFGGIVGGFSGAKQAAETAQDAKSFEELIESFTKFGELATDVNFGSIEQFLGMMEHFKEVGNLSAPIFDASGTLMSINPLELLGNTLYALGDGMDRIVASLDKVDSERLTNLSSFSQILNALTTAAGSLGDPTDATEAANSLRQFFDIMAGMDLWGYDIGDAAGKIAGKFTSSFNENIQNGSSSAQAAAQTVGQAAVNGVDMYTVHFQGIGWDMMSGLAQGILDGGDAVVGAISSVMSRAKAKAKTDLSIASPSKVFAEMGMYVDFGFAEGITKYSNRVEDATDVLSGKTISSMKEGLHNFSALIAEDINPNPTIRPVLDMTDVMSGLTTMDDAFASRNVIGLRGVQVGNVYGRNVLGSSGNQIINVNNSDVVAAIDAINTRLDTLTENFTNLQVVMNTGALVGEIAPAMDRELGSLAISGGRRG